MLQFRMRSLPPDPANPGAPQKFAVKPYIMDLDSTNGTHVNKERVPGRRYYELRERDVLTFGNSSREFVILCD